MIDKKKIVNVVQSKVSAEATDVNLYPTYFVCDDGTVYNIPTLPTAFKNGKYKYTTHTEVHVDNIANIICVYEEHTDLVYHHTSIKYGSLIDVVNQSI